MKVNSKKVREKIIDIAMKHCQIVKSIHQNKDKMWEFCIVVSVDVVLTFLNELSQEFEDKSICVFADVRDVEILMDVKNKNYWM